MMNERTEENVIREPLHKTPKDGLLLFTKSQGYGSVEELFKELNKKNTTQKTERDARLIGSFLKTKVEDRKVEAISAVELNEYISQFIISVSTEDGKKYEPTSLRSLTASFNRHLKKKGYSASIINDFEH